MQTLREWREFLQTLRAVEERGRSGDDEKQTGKATSVDLVDQLAQRIQTLLSNVSPDALESFHFIEHHQQSRMPRVAEHYQQTLQETQCGEVVHVTLQVRRPLDCGGDIGLASNPGDQSLRCRIVTVGLRGSIATQRRSETARGARNGIQPLLHQFIRGGDQRCLVVGIHFAAAEHVLFERIEPSVDDAAKRARRSCRRRDPLCQSAIDGFQAMQWRFRFRDLNFRGRKLLRTSLLLKPPGKERLPASILAPNRLERSAACAHALQVFSDRALKPFQANRETPETFLRDSSPPEGIQHLFSATWANGWCHASINHGELLL